MVVFVEPFGRPRLACGFDFFGEVFTAGNVSERCCPTSVMSQPINVDHQNENENPIHFDAPFVPLSVLASLCIQIPKQPVKAPYKHLQAAPLR